MQIVDLRSRTQPSSACSVEKVTFYPLISAHNALLTISFLANSQTTYMEAQRMGFAENGKFGGIQHTNSSCLQLFKRENELQPGEMFTIELYLSNALVSYNL